jgi:uncharacterized protein
MWEEQAAARAGMMSKVRHEVSADTGIDRERVIAMLRAHQEELHRRGVRHIALFGSIARAEGKRKSDIDILIELDTQAPVGLFEYVGITQYLADLFPTRVDVANRSSLKPLVRPTIERDAIYAF